MILQTALELSMQSCLIWAHFYMISFCIRIMPFHLPSPMSLKGQIDNNFFSGLRRVTVLFSKQWQERRGEKFWISLYQQQDTSQTPPTPGQFGSLGSSTWIPWHMGSKKTSSSIPDHGSLYINDPAFTGLGYFSFSRPRKKFADPVYWFYSCHTQWNQVCFSKNCFT